MYFKTAVDVPSKKGKLVFRAKGSSTYVYLETARTYNSDSRWNVPKRTVLESSSAGMIRAACFPMKSSVSSFPPFRSRSWPAR